MLGRAFPPPISCKWPLSLGRICFHSWFLAIFNNTQPWKTTCSKCPLCLIGKQPLLALSHSFLCKNQNFKMQKNWSPSHSLCHGSKESKAVDGTYLHKGKLLFAGIVVPGSSFILFCCSWTVLVAELISGMNQLPRVLENGNRYCQHCSEWEARLETKESSMPEKQSLDISTLAWHNFGCRMCTFSWLEHHCIKYCFCLFDGLPVILGF